MLIPKKAFIERLHDHLLERLGGTKGPLNPQLLEASIARAKTQVYGKEPFKGPVKKAIAISYGIVAWHPFVDGNKRTGVFTLIATLEANGHKLALPPYLVKYCVQAALGPDNPHHIDEKQFTRRVSALCYRQGSLMGRWREFRYGKWPNWFLQQYRELAKRFPNSRFYPRMLNTLIFDWYAAEDKEVMMKTLREWEEARVQGYPKEVGPFEVDTETDFEEAE
jgi:death on curing protein